MKNLQEAHTALVNMQYDLEIHSNSLSTKLEIIANFLSGELDDVIRQIDNATDGIEEMKQMLQEAQEAAEEWEEKYTALT